LGAPLHRRSEKRAVGKVTGFRETVPRNTAENTVHHRSDGGGSVFANHRSGGGISVTVTRLTVMAPRKRRFVLYLALSWHFGWLLRAFDADV